MWKKKQQPTILCKRCMQYDSSPRKPAVTIWEGNAYCEQHYHDQFMMLMKTNMESREVTILYTLIERVDDLANAIHASAKANE